MLVVVSETESGFVWAVVVGVGLVDPLWVVWGTESDVWWVSQWVPWSVYLAVTESGLVAVVAYTYLTLLPILRRLPLAVIGLLIQSAVYSSHMLVA